MAGNMGLDGWTGWLEPIFLPGQDQDELATARDLLGQNHLGFVPSSRRLRFHRRPKPGYHLGIYFIGFGHNPFCSGKSPHPGWVYQRHRLTPAHSLTHNRRLVSA